jgi:hypothetical protein
VISRSQAQLTSCKSLGDGLSDRQRRCTYCVQALNQAVDVAGGRHFFRPTWCDVGNGDSYSAAGSTNPGLLCVWGIAATRLNARHGLAPGRDAKPSAAPWCDKLCANSYEVCRTRQTFRECIPRTLSDFCGPTRTRTWNQGIRVIRGFLPGADYLFARNFRCVGAGRSSLSSRALEPSGSLCTFRRCTDGLAQDCHRPNR